MNSSLLVTWFMSSKSLLDYCRKITCLLISAYILPAACTVKPQSQSLVTSVILCSSRCCMCPVGKTHIKIQKQLKTSGHRSVKKGPRVEHAGADDWTSATAWQPWNDLNYAHHGRLRQREVKSVWERDVSAHLNLTRFVYSCLNQGNSSRHKDVI